MSKREVLTLALLIAIMPPIWAVFSPYFGISVGPIALIAAGRVHVENGKVTIGEKES